MDVIEVDKDTAETLKARAADRGISVAELLERACSTKWAGSVGPSEIAELDRRWAKTEEVERPFKTLMSCAGLKPGARPISSPGRNDD